MLSYRDYDKYYQSFTDIKIVMLFVVLVINLEQSAMLISVIVIIVSMKVL